METSRERIMDSVLFEDFLKKYEDKIREIGEMLSRPFEGDIDGLEQQISGLCSKMEFLSWCLAYADGFLTNARHGRLPAKRKDLTELDRDVALEYATAEEQKFKAIVEGLNRNIERYLSNAQSVLATKRVEMEKLGYGKRE